MAIVDFNMFNGITDADVGVTVTAATFGTTTHVPSDVDVSDLAWLIPLVVAVVAVLLVLAVALFYCVVRTEMAVLRRCSCCRTPDQHEDHMLLGHTSAGDMYSL